jgi:uncharacterized protein (UPF0332 family)
MPFDWKEYLTLAKQLSGENCTASLEAKSRAAVSRAYYAAFCFAENYAIKHLGYTKKESPEDHTSLLHHYEFKRGKNNSVCLALKDLRLWRNMCDYDEIAEINTTLVTNAIKKADGVFSALKS